MLDETSALTSARPLHPERESPDPPVVAAQHRTIAYRPQLDGLRAVAVLLVFVFHAVPTELSGGFIGVDVFFVLSGYLITLILLNQLARGERSMLRRFYVRRIRRLLPASLALLLAVAVYEALWGSVLALQDRFHDIRATVLYVANWHLIGQADEYFAESTGASPLRHMWSLAVEEQFYFVWPVVVVVAVHLGRRRTLLAGVTAAAIVASATLLIALYEPGSVVRAYYGTDTRVFQPLLGALLAVAAMHLAERKEPAGTTTVVPTVVGVASLAGIGVLAFRLTGTDELYFRGGAIVVAVLACGAIWALERSAPLARVVGCPPLAALGRISYAFYLWHWPIILWVRPGDGADWTDRRLVNAVQLLLTLAAAVASYVLVERPIRTSVLTSRTFVAFGGAAAAMAIVIGSSHWLLQPSTAGFGQVAADALADRSVQACPDNPQPCVMYEPGDPAAPTVLMVGDSTMQMYRPGLLRLAEQYGFRLVQGAVGGCPIGDRLIATGIGGELHKESNFTCEEAIPDIYRSALGQWPPDLILATSINEGSQHVTDGELVAKGTPEHAAQMKAALEDAVDVLTSTGAPLVFIDVLPWGPSVDCLDSDPPNSGSCRVAVPETPVDADVNREFAEVAAERPLVVGVIDLTTDVCPDGACPLTIDGVVTRYDGRHFTGTFSATMGQRLDERLRELGIDLSVL